MTDSSAAADEAAARRRLIALSVGFVGHAAWLAVVAEDAYISFRFGRNLSRGLGLVWNPGEAPVEGFTNLLWTLLAAAVEWSGLGLAGTMQLLGVAAGVATLWLTDRFAARVFGLGGAARTVPVLLLAASGPFATWAASGLETPLFALLALAGLYRLALWTRSRASGHLAAGWSAVALATLTRPEGLLLAAVAGWMTLGAAASGRSGRRLAWRFLVAFALFTVALTAARWAYFGAPLPNTFYAKTGGGGLQALRGGVYFAYFGFHFLVPLVPLLSLGWGRPAPAARGLERVSAALAAWCGVYALYIVAVGGDYMAMYRFFVPILPALYLLAGRSVSGLFGVIGAVERPPRTVRRLGIVLILVAGAGTLVHSTPLERELYEKPSRQHGTWRGVETERWHVARLERLARLFEERAVGRADPSLATRAIGILGYRTELAIYDFHGLVDPRIARGGRAERPIGAGLPGHEKTDYEHVLKRRPTWWMFSRTLREGAANWPRYDRETDRRLRREYEMITVEIEDEENGERGLFSFLERKDPKTRGGRSGSGRSDEDRTHR